MNACKAYELALKDTLAQFAECGENTFVWSVQNAQKDWDERTKLKAGRYFPQIRIEATPESAEENAWTFQTPVSIQIATHADDDPFCETRADIYEAVRGVTTALYFEMLDASLTATPTLDFLNERFSGYLNQGEIDIGGMTLPGNPAPGISGDIQTMAVELVFHWSQQYTTITPQG